MRTEENNRDSNQPNEASPLRKVLAAMTCGFLVYGVACAAPTSGSFDDGSESSTVKGGKGAVDGGSSSTNSPSGSSGGTDAGTRATDAQTPPSTSDGGATPVPSAEALACAQMTNTDSCQTCCESFHPSGTTVSDNAWDSCVCGTQGKCQTECAKSDCSDDDNSPDPVPGDACSLCEAKASNDDDTGSCDAQINAACNADADCAALNRCYDTCP